jgi:pantothenate kinase
MDGFHLAGAELELLGRAGRKGAPDTFDADGYVALLERLRTARATVHAPEFRRELEASVPGAIAVAAEVRLIITEGNYLLLDAPPWDRVRPLLAECWYVDLDDAIRLARLTERHIAHGRSPEAAHAWVREVDGPNAELVRGTRHRAELAIG